MQNRNLPKSFERNINGIIIIFVAPAQSKTAEH